MLYEFAIWLAIDVATDLIKYLTSD